MAMGIVELIAIFFILAIWLGALVLPFWKIFGKAGFSPWFSLTMVVPLLNIIMLYYLGFSKWPNQNQPGTT